MAAHRGRLASRFDLMYSVASMVTLSFWGENLLRGDTTGIANNPTRTPPLVSAPHSANSARSDPAYPSSIKAGL